MYKILIVDDEALARYALRVLITRNFPNLEIVGEAESGNQAIELANKLKPHIIIMDVKMPGINGIDASNKILDLYPEMRILILTAYDSFNYVQKALNIGVKGYVLKPLKKDEIVNKIQEIIVNIQTSEQKNDQSTYIDNKIKIVKPFIEKELVSAFAMGSIDINEVKSYLNFLQKDITSGYFMLINYGQNYSMHINDSLRNKINRDKVYEILTKFLSLMKKCIIGNTIGNFIMIFFTVEQEQPVNSVVDEAVVIANEIKRKIKVITNLDVSIGIGGNYKDIEYFRRSYNEANQAMKNAMKSNGIVHYSLLQTDSSESSFQYPVKLENELMEQLRMGDGGKSKELAIDIFKLVFNENSDVMFIKEYISQLIVMIKRIVFNMGIELKRFENTGLLIELNNLMEIEEIKLWSINTLYSIIEKLEEHKNRKENAAIKKIHEYVNKSFNKDITLEMVAMEVNLSPQYVSKIFKEELGMNFIDFITEKRIEYSKELLKSENGNIREISCLAGYSDANYFCRIFKKVTGLTPKEYRQVKR